MTSSSGILRVEVFGGGGVEEPAEFLDLVGCAVVALGAERGVGDCGGVEDGVLGVDRDAQVQGERDGVADPSRYSVFPSKISSA
jgi:hypothetical protein